MCDGEFVEEDFMTDSEIMLNMRARLSALETRADRAEELLNAAVSMLTWTGITFDEAKEDLQELVEQRRNGG